MGVSKYAPKVAGGLIGLAGIIDVAHGASDTSKPILIRVFQLGLGAGELVLGSYLLFKDCSCK